MFHVHKFVIRMTVGFVAAGWSFTGSANGPASSLRPKVYFDAPKNQTLRLEWYDDRVLHFEFKRGPARLSRDVIATSPLIAEYDWKGPGTFVDGPQTVQTSSMKTEYKDGCVAVYDANAKRLVARICADRIDQNWKTLKIETSGVQNIFGLGQMFGDPGSPLADHNGKIIATKGGYGNGMPSYAGGATGEAMFPVVTALGQGEHAWGLMIDNIYKQTWDLSGPSWSVGMFGDELRGFLIVGDNPKHIRRQMMRLGGKAPVPPRKLFGFWMSEYGYDNWGEVDQRLAGMRRAEMPIDGFFLDLQWFGNVTPGSDHTRMGTLTFDERAFPDAATRIKTYLSRDDIGMIPIEESYVGRALAEHDDLESRGYLAHKCGDDRFASYLTGDVTGNASEWWGRGGMLDWSNPGAGSYWHASKRQPLIEAGVFAHWLDLGEPEMFDPSSCYFGLGIPGKNAHQDIHNLFSFLWARSVWQGYKDHHIATRPFMMLRSGNFGLQRFGAGLWSGDIGGNLPSLTSHIASHENVSWSGIDYYSSDVGGFHRNNANGKPLTHEQTQENFTQWFANAAWFDIPLRSHVMNLDNDRDTSPATIGHVESNRYNLVTRYSLIPYYYSLAHASAQSGDPLFEPLAMRFPSDAVVRDTSGERMLGDLLIVSAAQAAVYATDAYLPAGLWYDQVDGHHESSIGRRLSGLPLYRNGVFRLPVFARAGALVPRLEGPIGSRGVGDASWKKLSSHLRLDAYVDPSGTQSEFDLYEDDGRLVSPGAGRVRVTALSQITNGLETSVNIKGAVGSFSGAEDIRSWKIHVWSPGWDVQSVKVNGSVISACGRRSTAAEGPCYSMISAHALQVSLPDHDARLGHTVQISWLPGSARTARAHFVCDEGRDASRGHGMFVSGSDSALGQWDPARAIPLRAAEFARGVWTGFVNDITPGQRVEYKCLRKIPGGGERGLEWQPGSNRILEAAGAGGFSGMAYSTWLTP